MFVFFHQLFFLSFFAFTFNAHATRNAFVQTFQKDEVSLIGKNLMDCHPPHARAKVCFLFSSPFFFFFLTVGTMPSSHVAYGQIEEMMRTHETNAYTIEKAGVKKLIYQAPWFRDGVFGGLVELSMVIPMEMPHYVRTPKA